MSLEAVTVHFPIFLGKIEGYDLRLVEERVGGIRLMYRLC